MIYRYPGNAHRELKTINNWRTEISALFGFIEHGENIDKPGRRAIELAENQDLVECFKVFLYNFQYPGAHIKPKNVLELIERGVRFKPSQYILKILKCANKDGGNTMGLTKAEVCHCIFNDLRVTRDNEGVEKTWERIKVNRQHKLEYDQTGDVIRYAGDIVDYMEIANLLKTYDSHTYYLNTLEEESIIKFTESLEWFSGYDISSVELDERKRYIEVKTTISSKPLHFKRVHLTKNEWNTASSTSDRYYVYRLMLSKNDRKLFLLQDPVRLYKQDLINMIPSDGAEITFDPTKVGVFEELLTWKN